ncbi:ImmA/IrrE family metallo-endopeptidase [Mucilaginibacter celer]|uniref:ImmA/IrrE family metallo-endopeptidase n=1 Tax=Mucilaginibacter celer TaxID=2305508 RepID=A0A494VMJ0_9SPHI|nr:ImmA/IrrE family metallo-endopeptidase [Mucilaginibacter celer]AYL96536.1 ImmA/IrrE family metallo-endopeptidase [Mucilaginibacter celer]
MDTERFEEIAELAEAIADEHFVNGRTDLQGILDEKNIRVIKGNYEDYFLGNLVHHSRKFYLYLNMDQLSETHQPRVRFTIAHELGHFFIDEHRNVLKKGTSLSFNTNHNNLVIEKEANHFASFLLMPPSKFKAAAAKLQYGIEAVLSLSQRFESSIDSTVIQYLKLNCCPGLMIRWNEDQSVKSWLCSSSLCELTGIKARPYIKTISNYFGELKDQFVIDGIFSIQERAVNLSTWLPSIKCQSPEDFVAIEQTIKLGKHGGLTLLTLS